MRLTRFSLFTLLTLLSMGATANPLGALPLPSLPSTQALEKQLAEHIEQAASPTRTELEETIRFRQEIDSNLAAIEAIDDFSRNVHKHRAQLLDEIDRLRHVSDSDWTSDYPPMSLIELGAALSEQLDALEKNQAEQADVNSETTRIQTLPEQAHSEINQALERLDMISAQLNNETAISGSLTEQRLQTEMSALQTRIERYNKELSVIDKKQDVARLRLQVLRLSQQQIEARLNTLQPLINLRRAEELATAAPFSEENFTPEVAAHPQVIQRIEENKQLRETLIEVSTSVNALIREAINTKTQLDKARALNRTVNEQIRMLDGSLLLSQVLYEQQKSLPTQTFSIDLKRAISEARLTQFRLERELSSLNQARIESTNDEAPADVQDALVLLRQEQRSLYEQLDMELSRKLAILTRTQLNRNQLLRISSSLHRTISEQTFWMPSTQPISLQWLQAAPAQVHRQLKNPPWRIFSDMPAVITERPFWLLILLLPAAGLFPLRRWLKQRIANMNNDVGVLRKDSQLHTPRSLAYTILIASPIPLTLVLFSSLFLLFDSENAHYLGVALGHLACLWFFIELMLHLLQRDGVAQHHFGWPQTLCLKARKQLRFVAAALTPLTFLITTGSLQPAQLSDDRLGLLIMVACLAVLCIKLPALLRSPNAPLRQQVIRLLAFLSPASLIILTALGYYYTSVSLAEHFLYTLYIVVVWILLEATAIRGLAVAAQRLAYRRVLAERGATVHDSSNSEAVEIEEPKLDLNQVNQQSLRLIRLLFFGVFTFLLYHLWADVLYALTYADNIVLWQSGADDGSPVVLPVSLADVSTAILIAVVTLLLVKNLPGLLEVLLLSRMTLKPGTSYAATTLLTYTLISCGIVLTLSTLGLSWDKLQWLVAALGVGLGFGLQEIFANFISGIIILFERPIRIGDVISIGPLEGTVSRIRIRATTIIDFDRKEIIVPNKVFVTERLINWSLSDTVTRITVKVGFAYGSNLDQCRSILLEAARSNPRIAKDPEPIVLFLNFGESTLDHELRVHVSTINDRLVTIDELNRRIDALCKKHDIEIAFNQLDIHVRNSQGDQLILPSETTSPKNNEKEPPSAT